MYMTNLRKVGGSVIARCSAALLDVLKLYAGATVGIAVEDGRLIVAPRASEALQAR